MKLNVYVFFCQLVSLFVTDKLGSLIFYPHISILNQQDPESAMVHN